MPESYVLRRRAAAPVRVPVLDEQQRAVVEHRGGPLRVLAGPGAGKTTTLVELVVDRVEKGELAPDEVLVLTFSRQAAEEIRGRIARRLSRTVSTTPAMTFHSFCYAFVRAHQGSDDFVSPMRLLSAPEQDTMLRDLVTGGAAERWPARLRPALRTRGFATELHRLMAATQTLDMDPEQLADVARESGRDDWYAAAHLMREYADVSALRNTTDYGGIVHQAVQLLRDPQVREQARRRHRLVVVDEYQDTDPLQVALLRELAGDGRDLVVVGDPYQSIYGFRGADVQGILEFPEQLATPAGPAPTIVLRHTNRYGAAIAAAVRSVVDNRGALGPVDGRDYAALRDQVSRVDDPGVVEVETYTTPAAEAEHIALRLREAHLKAEVPWRDMAVLVRTSRDIARLRRALTTAGVPVDVAGDELPLYQEPAVRTLLGALDLAVAVADGRPLSADDAEAVLTSPLGGLDDPALRRLGRALRQREAAEGRELRPARVLVAELLHVPAGLSLDAPHTPTGQAAAGVERVARLLQRAAAQIESGEPAEQVLWSLWDGTDWPRRLREEAESAGEGAARAHRDLDALVALFDEAARAQEEFAKDSLGEIVSRIKDQQIPAGAGARPGRDSGAVRLMTAHRSKGLEWAYVVVAGVQDGVWPDLRFRGSFLQSERLGAEGLVEPPSARARLAEERRLFYVACSRARRHLVVTATQSGHEDGDQPSRFVTELAEHVAAAAGAHARPAALDLVPRPRPRRALSLRGVVAELRRLGETTDDEQVRAQVADQLARLAAHPSARGANPERWWGLRERTDTGRPVHDPEKPIRLSGSSVSTLTECSLRWFLEHEAKAGAGTSSAQGFGSLVHALAADVVRRDRDDDAASLAAELDGVWHQLEFNAPWIEAREREAAVEAIGRFVRWHREHGRTPLAVEHPFEVTLTVEGREVVLRGSMDRVELDDAGGVHVIDLKTSKNAPSAREVGEHAQLGFYQLAVEHGATEELAPGAPPAGAELVQLRNDETKVPGYPKVQPQDAPRPDEPFFAVEQLAHAVRTIGDETWEATPSDKACGYCAFHRVCPTKDAGQTILGGGE